MEGLDKTHLWLTLCNWRPRSIYIRVWILLKFQGKMDEHAIEATMALFKWNTGLETAFLGRSEFSSLARPVDWEMLRALGYYHPHPCRLGDAAIARLLSCPPPYWACTNLSLFRQQCFLESAFAGMLGLTNQIRGQPISALTPKLNANLDQRIKWSTLNFLRAKFIGQLTLSLTFWRFLSK